MHWVAQSDDAPPLADRDGDGVPDWVQTTRHVFDHVWATEVGAMRYRRPMDDSSSPDHGPDGRLDVYLSDVGSDGLYGYCTSDDPHADASSDYRYRNVSAYCVVDDDFARSQFRGGASGLAALEVTAAHEFFHAVQFAYDWAEDSWLMEGTATWMEDQVYDGVDDNRQYLATSPLSAPGVPLDLNEPFYHYGAWIFWRFLSEDLRRGPGADPGIIREIWTRAAAGPGDRDRYSLQATVAALAAHGLPFRRAFLRFGVWNRLPAHFYAEGRHYPHARDDRAFRLGRSRQGIRWQRRRLDHLTTASDSFTPGRGAGPRARLSLRLALPGRSHGSAASIVVVERSGAVRARALRIGRSGHASASVAFDRRRVRRVELVLANASTRLRCWREPTPFSCSGTPLDDGGLYRFRARLVRR